MGTSKAYKSMTLGCLVPSSGAGKIVPSELCIPGHKINPLFHPSFDMAAKRILVIAGSDSSGGAYASFHSHAKGPID